MSFESVAGLRICPDHVAAELALQQVDRKRSSRRT
jgi:hypothetical protein